MDIKNIRQCSKSQNPTQHQGSKQPTTPDMFPFPALSKLHRNRKSPTYSPAREATKMPSRVGSVLTFLLGRVHQLEHHPEVYA